VADRELWIELIDVLLNAADQLVLAKLSDASDLEKVQKLPSGTLVQIVSRLIILRLSHATHVPEDIDYPAVHLAIKRLSQCAMRPDAKPVVVVSLYAYAAVLLILLYDKVLTLFFCGDGMVCQLMHEC
jgi:hypothetical protein